MKNHLHRGVLALMLSTVLLTGACASLPDSSSPQAIGTLATVAPGTSIAPPAEGREPDLLLRDFAKASTDPSNRHLAARQYLAPSMSAKWDDAASATIVDRVDTLSESRTDKEAVYTIRGNKVGRLEPGGVYVSEEGSYESKMTLTLVDGQWRISDLPSGVIMERPAFLGAYQRKSLYFPDPSGQTMVPDLRWVSGSQDQMASQLVGLLINGPKLALAAAVRNELGSGVSVIGPITKADGRTSQVGVGLGGVRIDFRIDPEDPADRSMDAGTRGLFASQIIWTLAGADISGPYVLLVDGKPLDAAHPDGWTTADVASTNPLATAGATVGLHALLGGSLVSVTEQGVIPVPGFAGNAGNLVSASLSRDGKTVAAVADTAKPDPATRFSLVLGPYAEGGVPVLEAPAITRPTWELDNNAIWAAVNGNTVVRVVREPTTGRASVTNVDVGALIPLGSNITELRLSRDGVRAAMIIDGKVYLATVVRMPSGVFALTSPRAVAPGLGSSALALDWSNSDTVVIARNTSDVPVVQVAIDGSRMDSLPRGNLTAPVVSVDASPTTEYVADARAVFQLNNNDPAGDRLWREVPGLTGQKAIPVLPG
ncbi:MtrAB system accessory lipoprotein LpqB [Rhodococcus sp. IEGM 1379]|uniref:MtrAB system accessory lipoprotein LpqB n=1 Tax=Rhodococcus sp. IEGM 1379 TaxID=3047086 RepID=UPI0024B81A20|nr:MtrAB system accessory lipoprotein LpqB [Rhodococcus sp. IEGM 1379]MDI9918911.1 MtrAB system accessory lipoprotein LpqB [Rhodococcus sp. IEGM 1379]